MLGACIFMGVMFAMWAGIAWSSLRHNRKFDAQRAHAGKL